MKIYSKKGFFSGASIVALGALNGLLLWWRRDLDGKGIALAAALILLGAVSLVRSLSRKMAKEDRADERDLMIEVQSKSKAFQLPQTISFALLAALLVMGKLFDDTSFIAMGVGLAFAFGISLLAEFFTYLYYEAKR